MADEPSWDDIFAGSDAERAAQAPESPDARPRSSREENPAPLSRRELRERERLESEAAAAEAAKPAKTERPARVVRQAKGERPPRQPKEPREQSGHGHRRGALILVIVLVVVLGGGGIGGYTIWHQYGSGVSALFGTKPSNDYAGSGNGEKVQFTIVSGDIGSTISSKLAKAQITKTGDAPYKLLLADPNISFQPGTYSMFEHMSAKSALDRLQSADARITTKLVVPEGMTLKGVIGTMASVTKIPVAQVTQAANDYTTYGLPSNATSLEGYLFPATYDLTPGKTARAYFQEMVDTMKQHLAARGVVPANYEHTIIFASLVQKEAGLAADYPKVARVFQNRLDDDMLLQSDATVAYGSGTTDTVTTTDAQRADAANKYNTYAHKGLPVGPISNPGDIALDAVLHPTAGSWLYFVSVNLDSGQTVFSTTYAEHQQAVTQFQTWLRAHPEYDK